MSSERDPKSYMQKLVLYAYPQVEPVQDNPDRLRRRWVTRVTDQLPDQDVLERTSEQLAKRGIDRLLDNYAESATPKQLSKSYPGVAIVRIDDHHASVEIAFPAPAIAIGDAALIATWDILQGFDEMFHIEELEGIPKRFWFLLR